MTAPDLDRTLQAYADLAVRVGLNLQSGQRLMVIGPLAHGGVALEAAPLVRQLAACAYQAGAPLVEALWGDEPLQLIRLRNGGPQTFSQTSAWLPRALAEHVESGHAVLSIYANDPDLVANEPSERVSTLQQAVSFAVRPFRELISRNATNWAVIAAPTEGWAAKVFPDQPADRRVPRLWEEIRRLCRLDRPDPVASWNAHLEALAARSEYLNARRYDALRYTAPGTSLLLGLPDSHLWVSGRTSSGSGIPFTANLPTEEVFTIAHKDRVEGTVRSTKPLSYAGTVIDGFTLRFERGRVVNLSAERGEDVLRRLLDTDEGAARLGEVALVPHSSPVSQSGLLFYNTLFDENAASHVALGSAYKFTVREGYTLDDQGFERAGGNRSAVHVDFMIGSGDLDVDGVLPDGSSEPLIRRGEFVARVP